jgi:DNA repair exonuclease SbcCD ATPase subunit
MSIDYLTNDPIIPTNQKYSVLSLYMNEDKKVIKCVKVSGAFPTLEEAQEQIQIIKEPGHYNFVAEIGTWNAFDPLPNKGDLNDQLNTMMQKYLIGMHKKNYDFDQRKFSMIISNYDDNIKIKTDELKEYEEKKDDVMITKINDQIKNLLEKKAEYKVKLDAVEEKLNDIVIDSKYRASQSTEVTDNFNQNVPIKFEGKVNRTNEKILNQHFYCISFLVEEGISLVGIKVSGCFETEDSANNHSAALRDINESFNILVGKLYEWCPFNPDPDSAEAGSSEYANPELNETMKKKQENEQKAKLYHEYRKNETVKKNIEDLISNKKKENMENKKKLENQSENKDTSIENKVSNIDDQIKKLEEKMKEYESKEIELAKQIDPKLLQNKNTANMNM